MRVLIILPLLAFWSVTTFAQASAQAAAGVKSYKEWKLERVSVAQVRVTSIKNQIENRKAVKLAIAQGVDPNLQKIRGMEAASSSDFMVERLERQLKMEQFSLDLAKDLSVTDYFAGYLTKVQNKKAAFQEVAGKLSAEEVAELMNAYANSVFGAHASDLPASAENIEKASSK